VASEQERLPQILDSTALASLFNEELQKAFESLGCFNLAIFGKTGSGKSTLLNAIFAQAIASTGIGESVTKGLNYYRHPNGYLGIYDSEGFETGTSGDAILTGLDRIVSKSNSGSMDQRIHAVWYLVRWSDRRFEVAQQSFITAIAELGLPVIIVMSQVPVIQRDGGFEVHPDAVIFAKYIESLALPTFGDGKVLLTNALPDSFSDTVIYGLQELLDATYEVVPLAAQAALTAAQGVDGRRKKDAAAAVIKQATVVASGIGAVPIPVADAALLVPNQVAMIARITAIYGLPRSRARALSIAGTAILTGGATFAGRYVATHLLRFLPGGIVVGSVISGTVAATLTRTIGFAWVKVCEYAITLPDSEQESFFSSSQVREAFNSYLKSEK
jgi:uncharacterized protein (DUF697 family)/GTP-binding protein EngB required for normal cell division